MHCSHLRTVVYPSIQWRYSNKKYPQAFTLQMLLFETMVSEKGPWAIVPQWSNWSQRYPNLAMFTSQNSGIPEYTMRYSYTKQSSVYIACDISWGHGLSVNDHQTSCHSSQSSLRETLTCHDSTQILRSLKHWYCNWYELRQWVLGNDHQP